MTCSARLFTAILAVAALTAACAPAAPEPTTPPMSDNLIAALQTTVSVKELMGGMIDPASDFIFLAVGSETSATETRSWQPETDQDWEKVKLGALVMAEGAQLLRLHRPWTPAGDNNDPEHGEISPDEIEAKLQQDPVLWDAKVQALQNVGREVLAIVERRDVQELFNAGEDLDHACEDCHLEYWYPGQLEFLEQIDRRLRELYGARSGTPEPPR